MPFLQVQQSLFSPNASCCTFLPPIYLYTDKCEGETPSPEAADPEKCGDGAVAEEKSSAGAEEEISDIAGLWAQLCKKKVQLTSDGDNSNRFLTCPPGYCWRKSGKIVVKDIFIRDSYDDLFYLWWDNDYRDQFIGGTPGTGLSTYIWYVLYSLMEKVEEEDEEKFFLWITQEQDVYRLSSKGGCEKLLTIEHEDVDCLFVDIGHFELPPGVSSSTVFYDKLLVTSSFRFEVEGLSELTDYSMQPYHRRFMPVWSFEEAEAAVARVFGDKPLDFSRLQALFLIFGGSIRLCLENYPKSETLDLSDTSSLSLYEADIRYFYSQVKLAYENEISFGDVWDAVYDLLEESRVVQLFEDVVVPTFTPPTDNFELLEASSLLFHSSADGPSYNVRTTRFATRFCEILLQLSHGQLARDYDHRFMKLILR